MANQGSLREWQVPNFTIPSGLCQCGCGGATAIATRNRGDKGWVKGQPKQYIWGHNSILRDEEKEPEFWSRMRFVPSILSSMCWQWIGHLQYNGYGVGGRIAGERAAHRIAFRLVRGEIPKGLELDHLCRNRACINPLHLEPVTSAANTQRGLKAKLTYDMVMEIRESQLSDRKLAAKLGIHHSTINHVRTKRTWK